MYIKKYDDLTVIKTNNHEYKKALDTVKKPIKYFSAYCDGDVDVDPVFDYQKFYDDYEEETYNTLGVFDEWYEYLLNLALKKEINKVIDDLDKKDQKKDLNNLRYVITYK